ncbi:MAG: DinB family protein [Saprospiraceae bacterium]
MTTPLPTESSPYFQRYIKLVNMNIMTALSQQESQMIALAEQWNEDDWNYRYAPEKWTRKECFLHQIDTERVFVYRALRIARGDKTAMAGFDQDLFVANSEVGGRSGKELIQEYQTVRQATLAFFQYLPTEVWQRIGTASENSLSVRAAAYIIAGHELHHIAIYKNRYESA